MSAPSVNVEEVFCVLAILCAGSAKAVRQVLHEWPLFLQNTPTHLAIAQFAFELDALTDRVRVKLEQMREIVPLRGER